MNADTFVTRSYKGGFIHSYYDRDLKQEVVTYRLPFDDTRYPAKSWRAAQILITRRSHEHAEIPRP